MLLDIDILPPQCQQANAQGQVPTCVQLPDGTWQSTYPGADSGGSGVFSGVAGFIGVAFVIILVLGILGAVWRVRMARRIAEGAGLDPDAAAAMSVLTPYGLEGTYLAATLRGAKTSTPPSAPATDVAARLRQLGDLKAQGLITDAEFAERRSAIIRDV